MKAFEFTGKHWRKPLYLLAIVVLCRWAALEFGIEFKVSSGIVCAGKHLDERVAL